MGLKANPEDIFIKIASLENEFEAQVLKDALDKEQIPTLIRCFKDTAYDGIYILQKGWGNILVPEKYKEKATQIVSALKADFKE